MKRFITWRSDFAEASKVINAADHGPEASVEAASKDITLHPGYKRFACTKDKERVLGMEKDVVFMLETALPRIAGQYSLAPNIWGKCVVVERERLLITG